MDTAGSGHFLSVSCSFQLLETIEPQTIKRSIFDLPILDKPIFYCYNVSTFFLTLQLNRMIHDYYVFVYRYSRYRRFFFQPRSH